MLLTVLMGDLGYKQRLMQSYRDQYTRFSAFAKELRQYGCVGEVS